MTPAEGGRGGAGRARSGGRERREQRARSSSGGGGAADGHGHSGRGPQAAPQPGAADGGGRGTEPDRARGKSRPVMPGGGARSCQAAVSPSVRGPQPGSRPSGRLSSGRPGDRPATLTPPPPRLPWATAPWARGTGASPLVQGGPGSGWGAGAPLCCTAPWGCCRPDPGRPWTSPEATWPWGMARPLSVTVCRGLSHAVQLGHGLGVSVTLVSGPSLKRGPGTQVFIQVSWAEFILGRWAMHVPAAGSPGADLCTCLFSSEGATEGWAARDS